MDIRSSNIAAGATMTSSQDENITHKSLELVRSASETSLSSNRSKVSSISLGDNSGFTASGEHSIASTDASIIPGRWKYSKTRQLAFWFKKSMRNVIIPDLNSVYETNNDSGCGSNSDMDIQSEHGSSSSSKSNASQDKQEANIDNDHMSDSNEFRAIYANNGRGDDDSGYLHPPCENIDEAMNALHSFFIPLHPPATSDDGTELDYAPYQDLDVFDHNDRTQVIHPYDWILDGDPELIEDSTCATFNATAMALSAMETDNIKNAEDDPVHLSQCPIIHEPTQTQTQIPTPPTRSHAKTLQKEFGDEKLDFTLAGLELELEPNPTLDSVETIQRFRNLLSKSTEDSVNTCNGGTEGEDPRDIDDDNHSQGPRTLEDITNLSDDANGESCGIDEHDHSGHDHGTRLHNLIPSFLPFEDPSTPEGSFIRRLQVEFDTENEASEVNLPLEYFDPNHDPILEILRSVPWHDDEDNNDWVELTSRPNEQNSDDSNFDGAPFAVDQYLTETLSSLDELKQQVTAQLLLEINRKDEEIALEMKRAQAVDHDIASALSYSRQANSYLQRARGVFRSVEDKNLGHGGSRAGLMGGLYILEEAEQRDRLSEVDGLLKDIEELVVMEASVFDFCNDFATNLMLGRQEGINSLLETCRSLKSRLLHDERFLQLRCLDESRQRVSQIMEYSCQRIEESLTIFLSRRCSSSGSTIWAAVDNWNEERRLEYNNLLNARLIFDDYRLQESKCHEHEDSDAFQSQSMDFASNWSSCILAALCFEADRCLSLALLDPSRHDCDEDEEPSEFDANFLEIKLKLGSIQAFTEDAASLRSITKNLFSLRFEFDTKQHQISGIFHKLCVLLADVLHSHYMLSEWHRCQIDDNSNGPTVRNQQCPSPLQGVDNELVQVEKTGAITRDDHTKSTSSSNGSHSSNSSHLEARQGYTTTNSIPQCISGPESDETGGQIRATFDHKNMTHSILETRVELWKHCKGVIIKFLKTITDYESEKENCNWSLTWIHNLESYYDIYMLCTQMNKFGKEFLGPEAAVSVLPLNDPGSKCELKETLSNLFEILVHGAHAEAMTEIGTMMATETWDLLPIPFVQGAPDEKTGKSVRRAIRRYLKDTADSLCAGTTDSALKRFYHNGFKQCEEQRLLPEFCGEIGNPFWPSQTCIIYRNNDGHENADPSDDDEKDLSSAVYAKVTLFAASNSNELVLGTRSALHGLARWTIRLLKIQRTLSIVEDQVGNVLSNIYDLYFLTAFRLCTGNAVNEGIVLGNTKRSDLLFNERFPQDLPPSASQLKAANPYKTTFGRTTSFNRRRHSQKNDTMSNPKRLGVLISPHCEADMFAPLKVEENDVSKVRKFIYRGQAALSSMISLNQIENWSVLPDDDSPERDANVYSANCLEKYISVSSSCLFVACLFDVAFHSSDLFCSDGTLAPLSNAPLSKYRKQMFEAVSRMHSISLRMCGTRAIVGRDVVSNIVSIGEGWSESKLNEHCNSYIDNLSNSYVNLWHHLSISPLSSSKELLFDAWEHVVESGFQALLEGFSKIYDCSTEGRALMSIDLATFACNVDRHTLTQRIEELMEGSPFLAPPSVSPSRGMQYVDMYIKVFYFPREDMMPWISENRNLYHLSHLLTLVSFGAHNQLKLSDLKQLSMRRDAVKKC